MEECIHFIFSNKGYKDETIIYKEINIGIHRKLNEKYCSIYICVKTLNGDFFSSPYLSDSRGFAFPFIGDPSSEENEVKKTAAEGDS
ncbi:hypothetical protein YC2023_076138 [Brassica napus]